MDGKVLHHGTIRAFIFRSPNSLKSSLKLCKTERLKSKINWLRTHFHNGKRTTCVGTIARVQCASEEGLVYFFHEDVRRQSHGFFRRARVMLSSCLRICRWDDRPFTHRAFSSKTVRTGTQWRWEVRAHRDAERIRQLSSEARSTPADSEGEYLFIEAGARHKVCVFPRARPGKDALEWSDVQLASAIGIGEKAGTWSFTVLAFVEVSIKMNWQRNVMGAVLESMHVVPLDWLRIKLWLTPYLKLNQTAGRDFTAIETCGSGIIRCY